MDKQVVTCLMGRCFDTFEHWRKKSATDLGQQQTNRVRSFACEYPRRVTRHELEFFHRQAHSICFCTLNGSRSIEHAADSSNGNIGMAGNICDGGWAAW